MTNSRLAPVSVVIPCYRCGATISRAVSSVYYQSWRPREVILVDDFSGDDTVVCLSELKEKYPDGWIQIIELDVNDGPGTARNVGWEHATQPYVAFLDADDAWHHQKIDIQTNWMLSNPNVALTGHACIVASSKESADKVTYSYEESKFQRVSSSQLLASNRFPTPSVMLKRDIVHRFVCGKRYIEDFLLWCEICLDGYDCFRCDLPLVSLFKADYGESGLSGDLWKMEKGELDAYYKLRISRRIGFSSFAFFSIVSLVKYLRRVLLISSKWR